MANIEIDNNFINKHNFFIEALKQLTGKEWSGFSSAPFTYPVPAPAIVRHYARLLGIPTTETGLVFLIDKVEDFDLATVLVADLYKTIAASSAKPED